MVLVIFINVVIPIIIVLTFFAWLFSVVEGKGKPPFSKKECLRCGKRDKKKRMEGHVFDASMQVIYFCPECDIERNKGEELLKKEYVRDERGF